MAYEIDETTSLLARHVAALDDIYAKITTLSGQGQSQGFGQGHGLGQGQGLGLGQAQGQGLISSQGGYFEPQSRMNNNQQMPSDFPRHRLHLDVDENNTASNINNNNNNNRYKVNENRSSGALISTGVHNEDTMAIALREQISVSDPYPIS